MNSLEGRRGNPRIKPPFPAVVRRVRPAHDDQQRRNARRGAARSSTTAPSGTRRCASATPRAPGTKLYSVCGNVRRPGNYEVVMGFPFKEFLYDLCGGPPRRPRVQGDHSRRCVGPDPDDRRGRSDGHGLRGIRRRRHDAGIRRRHLHRRLAVHGEADRPARAVLCARELCAVHAVPRGHGVDDQDHGAHRVRAGHARGPRHAPVESRTT